MYSSLGDRSLKNTLKADLNQSGILDLIYWTNGERSGISPSSSLKGNNPIFVSNCQMGTIIGIGFI